MLAFHGLSFTLLRFVHIYSSISVNLSVYTRERSDEVRRGGGREGRRKEEEEGRKREGKS